MKSLREGDIMAKKINTKKATNNTKTEKNNNVTVENEVIETKKTTNAEEKKEVKDPYDIKVDMKKLLELDVPEVPAPKCNGIIPGEGDVINLYEAKFYARMKKPVYDCIGEYTVKRITNCFVECVKNTKSGYSYYVTFKISDFRAGLYTFESDAPYFVKWKHAF